LESIPSSSYARLDNSRNNLGYFANYNTYIHFFNLELLTGNVTLMPKKFHDPISSFLWMNDKNTIIFSTQYKDRRNQQIKLFNKKLNLILEFYKIRARAIKLECLDKNNKFLVLNTTTKNSQIQLLDLETKELRKVTSVNDQTINSCFYPTNDWIVYSACNLKKKDNNKIWFIKADGSEKFTLFTQNESSDEKIIGTTEDGNWLAFKCIENGSTKSGILNLTNGVINWLPLIDEEIVSISANDKLLVTFNRKNNEYCLLDMNLNYKETLPFDSSAYNIQFCIDNEFLLFTKNTNGLPCLALYDIIDRSSDLVMESNNRLKNTEQITNWSMH
jgi:Tol biopolymer transport system component